MDAKASDNMREAETPSEEDPDVWGIAFGSAISGLLFGAVSVVAFFLLLLWLSWFLPLPHPPPASYYGPRDCMILCITTLVYAGFFALLRRRFPVFAVAFTLAAACLLLFEAFLQVILPNDGSYIP